MTDDKLLPKSFYSRICYGASKAALTSFGNSLFDEARKYGVKVVNIHPDMTESLFYRNADFTSCDEEDERLLPEEIAQCVMSVLAMREGACFQPTRRRWKS